MISRDVFYARLDGHCKVCRNWRGVCVLGHPLQSPLGCPEHKFPPVGDAIYFVPRAVPVIPDTTGMDCCGSASNDVPRLTWPEALAHLTKSLAEWHRAGYPVSTDDVYAERIAQCKSNVCGQYAHFVCRVCKCPVTTKARLVTETCPKGFWKR